MSDPVPRLSAVLSDRYTIQREIGAGGMATVYLAHDLRHDRKVALKVLKPELAAVVGADRFLAEIRTTANLQHPHILPLFDSGEADGFLYFVMPFVEGESLRDRLDREKQLPVDEAVRIATEVADALEHAHAKGVIHRDIKPANILLRDGRVQVADFGIALAVQHAGGARLTETGLSVGTPHYMSPEQASGDRQLDGRSDVYSLGCVLYEMLAGEPPHTGPTAQSILSKILTDDPRPVTELRRAVPVHVAAVVQATLEKLPADRLQSAGEFRRALAGDRTLVRHAPRRSYTTAARWRGAAIAASLVAAAAIGYFARPVTAPDATAASAVSTRITFDEVAWDPAVSPDGTQIVYIVSECPSAQECRPQLMLQDLAGGDPIPLGPTIPVNGREVGPTLFRSIGWSPDGQRILFSAIYADEPSQSGLYTMPRLGGTPAALAAGITWAATWHPAGDQVDWIEYPEGRENLPVIRSRASSGAVETHALSVPATMLEWSPDGNWLALIGHQEFGRVQTGPTLTIVGRDWQIADQIRVDRWVGEAWLRVRWNATGDALYTLIGGDLFRVGVASASGTFDRAPEIVIGGIERAGIEARGTFDVGPDDRFLVFARSSQRTHLRTLEAAPGGLAQSTLAVGMTMRDHPALSPDGQTVAYLREDQLGTNLYLRPFTEGRERALTVTPGHKMHPRWSPDGTQLAYIGFEADGSWLYTVSTAGGQTHRRARVATGRFPPHAWFPDGSRIFFQAHTGVLSVVSINGAENTTEELFELPGEGLSWGFLVRADGHAVAAFHFGIGAQGILPIWVDVASLDDARPDWKTVFRDEWTTFDRTAYVTDMPWPEWQWQTPQAWEAGDRFIISYSHRQGRTAHGGLWRLHTDRQPPELLHDLGEHCGAPSYVTRSNDGRRLVCIYREMSTDIWRIENFDPEDHTR